MRPRTCVFALPLALALALAGAVAAQPAPEPFRELGRSWAQGDQRYLLQVDEATGVVHLSGVSLAPSGPPPLLREGQLSAAERAELRQLAAVVAGLLEDQGGGLLDPAWTFTLGAGTPRYFVPTPGGPVEAALRPLSQALDRLAARLTSAAPPPAFFYLRRVRDGADGRVVDAIEAHADGTVEARETVGSATRILPGKLLPAERAALGAAIAAADLPALVDEPAAAGPRVRLRFALELGSSHDRTLSGAGPAALGALHTALDAIAARLKASAAPGWATIHRGGRPSSLEVHRGWGKVRLPHWSGWVALTPEELQALDAAAAQLDLAALPSGPIVSDTYFDLVMQDGLTRRINRNRDAQGQLPEAGLQALDAALERIVSRVTGPNAPTPSYSGGVVHALGEE